MSERQLTYQLQISGKIVSKTKPVHFHACFYFFVLPEAILRYTRIFLMKSNRKNAQPMHFHDCFFSLLPRKAILGTQRYLK